MTAPHIVIREASDGLQWFDLLFYDDVLAVVPRPSGRNRGDFWSFAGTLLASLFSRTWPSERRADREAERRFPPGTRLLPLERIASVHVEAKPYGAATLTIDDLRVEVPMALTYRDPWDRLLGPVFGDRLTVV